VTTGNIVIVVFCLALIANVVALVRHWRALRRYNSVLNNFAEAQEQWIMEAEKRKADSRNGLDR